MTVAMHHAAPAELMAGDTTIGRWVSVLAPAAALADRIADTEFVPEAMRGNSAVVCAAIMYGDELGVGPMQALSGINIIKGKPSPSSELMRALVFRAGHTMQVLKSDGSTCRIVGKRAGHQESTVIEWTIGMAQAAGLVTSNPTWKRYPRAMLLARATSELCRVLFPDVVKGLGHVIDDEATAQGFDDWASHETGEQTPPPPETRTVSRRKPPTPPSITPPSITPPSITRPVKDTELPDPDGYAPTKPPSASPEPPDAAVPPWETPSGVTQPPLPDMPTEPPQPPTAGAGIPSPDTVNPAPDPAVGPLPVPDDTEPARDAEPIGPGRLLTTVHTMFGELGLGTDDRAYKLAIASAAVGRRIESTKLLTRHEALTLVRVLNDLNQGLMTFGVLPDGSVELTPTSESE